jgi:hypothetical protein
MVLKDVRHRLKELFYAATGDLRAYELDAILCLGSALGPSVESVLREQLVQPMMVQRFAADSQVNIYFHEPAVVPLLPDVRESRRMGKVEIILAETDAVRCGALSALPSARPLASRFSTSPTTTSSSSAPICRTA